MVITNPELGLHIVWGTLSSTQARPAFGLDLGFILGQWAASWAGSKPQLRPRKINGPGLTSLSRS